MGFFRELVRERKEKLGLEISVCLWGEARGIGERDAH